MHKGLFVEALRRLGMAAALLPHHDIKLLVDINPELDRCSARIKLRAGFLE